MYIGKCLLSILCFIIIIGVTSDAAATPVNKNRLYFERKGEMIWEVNTNQQMLALTFDDGPDQEQTNQILDLLKKYKAKCTFFVIGKRVAQYPEIAMRIVTEGHEIANHTYNHTYFKLPNEALKIRQEIEQTESEIYHATGRNSYLFRPPGGWYDETIVQISNQMGLIPVMWSWHQDTEDWRKPGVRKITNKVLHNAHNGDIVLFHDHVAGKTQTIAALELLLPELHARGYQLVTVSELIKSSITY